jgi:hypothetical protein
VALGSKMDNCIDFVVVKNCIDNIPVADVTLDKSIMGIFFNTFQIIEIAGIGQDIKIDDLTIRMGIHHVSDKIAPDEACTAGDQ